MFRILFVLLHDKGITSAYGLVLIVGVLLGLLLDSSNGFEHKTVMAILTIPQLPFGCFHAYNTRHRACSLVEYTLICSRAFCPAIHVEYISGVCTD